MTSEKSQSATPKTRQRFNVGVGWLGVAVGVALALGGWGSGQGSMMAFVGIAFAIAAYLFMAQPYLMTQGQDVVIHNILREVRIPWSGISHASSRGSLVIHDNDGGRTTVWAIGSQKARVQRDDDDSMKKRSSRRPQSQNDLVALPTSALALREAINAEVIDNPPGASGKSVRWLPVNALLAVFGLVMLVVGIIV